MRKVLIFDLDPEVIHRLSETFAKDFQLVETFTFSSLAEFMEDNFNAKSQPLPLPQKAENEDFPFADLTLILTPESLDLVEIQTPWADDILFAGFKLEEFKQKPSAWQSLLFVHPKLERTLKEACGLASSLQRPQYRKAVLKTADGRFLAIDFEVEPISDQQQLKAKIKPAMDIPEASALEGKKIQGPIDLMLFDTDMYQGEDLSAFLAGFEERARESNLIESGANLPVILTSRSEPSHQTARHLKSLQIRGFITKPLDIRTLNIIAAHIMSSAFTIYRFDNLNILPVSLNIHVAREAKITELSEFGATLKLNRPLAPGTLLFLRGGIFENAPNRCLAARFFNCEESQDEDGIYLCSAVYFGINDAFMKFARRWFRETYAASKQGSSQS